MKRRAFTTVVGLALLIALAPGGLRADDSLGPFERAAELSPQDPGAQFNLGVMCLKAGDYAQAAQALQKATSLAPRDAESWEAYGTALLQLRRASDAVQALKQATALDAGRAGAWQDLGQALVMDGSGEDLAAAADAYGHAAHLKPEDALPLLNQGLVLARLGRDAEALAALSKAAGMDGGQGAFKPLCMLYNKAGNYAKAEDACRRALQGDGGAESWYNLGFALQGDSKNADARVAYRNALRADPGHAGALYAVAYLDFQAGDAAAALQGFQAAIKAKNGDYPEAEYNAAVLLGDQGSFEDAAELYRSFLKTHPDDPDANANLKSVTEAGLAALLERGQDAYERGDIAAARGDWQRAQALDPSSLEAARMLKLAGAASQAPKAVVAARVAARPAVARRLRSDDSGTKRRGMAAFKAGRDAEAVRLLGFYLRNNPDDLAVKKALTQARARTMRRGSVRAAAKKVDQEAVRKLYYDGVEQYLAGDLRGAVATWTEVLRQEPDHLDAQRSLARAQVELAALKRISQQ
ncbi:MAG TPA: tetratricopeptide repeat protein [bacterium]|nr:tetratricopeptide repeat protein [bacterium]